jgi:hypothetical protein
MGMRGDRRKRRGQLAALEAAAAEAMADVTCARCGRVFEGRAAHTIHDDRGQCLPGEAYGQLVELKDGRWAERWRYPDRTVR